MVNAGDPVVIRVVMYLNLDSRRSEAAVSCTLITHRDSISRCHDAKFHAALGAIERDQKPIYEDSVVDCAASLITVYLCQPDYHISSYCIRAENQNMCWWSDADYIHIDHWMQFTLKSQHYSQFLFLRPKVGDNFWGLQVICSWHNTSIDWRKNRQLVKRVIDSHRVLEEFNNCMGSHDVKFSLHL